MRNPDCPDCGYHYTDDDIWHSYQFPTELDGEDSEVVCPDCKCRKWVTLSLSPSWDFEEVEE